MPSELPLWVLLAGESVDEPGIVELSDVLLLLLLAGGGVESIALGLLCDVAGAGGGTFSFLLQPLNIRPAMATTNKLRCIISFPSMDKIRLMGASPAIVRIAASVAPIRIPMERFEPPGTPNAPYHREAAPGG